MTDDYEILITPGRVEKNYWKDLWRFRELFYVLSWRDVKVRYKQTTIGAAWSIIRPFLTMVVLTVVFGKIAKLPADGKAPYSIMVFAAMLPWQFFSNALSEAGNSLIGNSNLISKVYFPRLIIPSSSLCTSFVDLMISFGIMILMMCFYSYAPPVYIILLPVFIVLAFFATLGISLYLSALNVKYRDFRYIIPFIVQFGLYVSPVGFSSKVIPEKWRLLYSVNPMVSVIDGFRFCIIGEEPIYWPGFVISVASIILLTVLGLWYFRKTERFFSDTI